MTEAALIRAHLSIPTHSKPQPFLCASPEKPARRSHFGGKGGGGLISTSIYKASWMPCVLCCPSDFPSWGHSAMCCTFRTTAGYLGGLAPPPAPPPPSVSSKVRKVTHSTPVCGHVSAWGRQKPFCGHSLWQGFGQAEAERPASAESSHV